MDKQRSKHLTKIFIACCMAGFILFTKPAAAEITSVTINSVHTLEALGGYIYMEATMKGTVARDDGTTGRYSVPLIMKYPISGGSGVGVVDWVTSARLQNEDWIEDEFLIGQLLLITAGDYLYEEGYTYAAVQWGKGITELFGPSPPGDGRPYNHLAYGTIEQGADAWEILRDAARFLRNPGLLRDDPFLQNESAPRSVDVVISSGYSQTGALQMGFLSEGQNVRGEEVVYDGHLIAKMGYICPQLNDIPPDFGMIPQPCRSSPAGDPSKVIHITAQGDLEFMFMAALTRFPEVQNWRQYELAGVAHVTPKIIDTGGLQNPVDSGPAIRGALNSLVQWIRYGIPAPPSQFLAGSPDEENNFVTELDNEGNAVGGLRLPHMEQIVDGEPAGAPLGVYTGLNPDGEPPYGLFAGTYLPFDQEELDSRYPNHGVYVNRVARAAEKLLDAGYIVERDKDAFIKAAREKSTKK